MTAESVMKEAHAAIETDLNPLPEGDYAIVEVLGHRTLVGRVAEVERFATKFLSVEAIWQDALLPAALIGGASIYQFTPCSREIAREKQARYEYQLPAPIKSIAPVPALPAPEAMEPEWTEEELDKLQADIERQNEADAKLLSRIEHFDEAGKRRVFEFLNATLSGFRVPEDDELAAELANLKLVFLSEPEDGKREVALTCAGQALAMIDDIIPF